VSTNPSRVQVVPLQQPTSREAFRAHDPTTVDGKMLAYLEQTGGSTDWEMQQALGVISATQTGNRRHLVERGLVYATEERRPTPSGRDAIVWRLQDSPVRGPQCPPFVPPNDGQAQGRLFPVSAASAKKLPKESAWNL
jgi:hypothetical protein